MTEPRQIPAPSTTGDVTPNSDSGLSASQLVTYFQPFYNLRTDRLQGFEALTRRRSAGGEHTELPGDFFERARAEHCMREIDLHVLEDTLEQLAQWRRDEVGHELVVSVNLAPETVGHEDVVRDISLALARHDVPGHRLLLDLTTADFRAWWSADRDARDRMRRLQDAEIAFCLDAFTSEDLDLLSTAVDESVDIIKLHPRQLAGPTEAMTSLARDVQDAGLPVVAAGIETTEQLALVRDLGFEWAQGFFLGKPVDAKQALSYPGFLGSA